MALREHQGATPQGSGAQEIIIGGRAGPFPAGAGPTTSSEEGGQPGDSQNPEHQAPPWDEVELKLRG